MYKSNLIRTPQMVGQAGAHHAAAQLLKHGIISLFPNVDVGYDLLTDAGGVLRRVQVKTELDGNKARPNLGQLRYSLRRRKTKKTQENDTTNFDKRYTTGMIDAMIFVTFRHDTLFIIPSREVDFKRDWIYYEQLRPWENAWWALTE